MRPHVILRYVGLVLMLNAAFIFAAFLISFFHHDDGQIPLLLSCIITLLWGVFPMLFVPKTVDLSNREAYLVMVLSWIMSCVVGMLPFLFWGGEFNLMYAFFESVSGYTTSGASILNDIEALPKGLLFWRSSMHWIGGMGVIMFMLLVMPSLGKAQKTLSRMEVSSLAGGDFRYKTQRMLQIILTVYIGLTCACCGTLLLLGMEPFDAVNHAFSIIATGGFSTRNASIGAFDSLPIELASAFFMFVAGIHFGLLYATITFKKTTLFHSPVVRYYFFSTLLGAVVIALNLHWNGLYDSWGECFRQAGFQAVCISTTTGFATANTAVWPPLSIAVLIFFTIQCGCSGSTSGGLKVDRVVIFFQSLRGHILRLQHPQAVIPIKVGRRIISEETATAAIVFIIIYLGIIFLSTILLAAFGVDLITGFTASAAAMGSTGPGFGLVGSASNYSCLPDAALVVLCFDMLLGRLEIFGLLLLFLMRSWR
ncbi:MAG: TrkH family potassium uptake protein [Bacteroidales bacterium]|nr:TrkH family potassium uptake protein [Bacteroidales bacterium]